MIVEGFMNRTIFNVLYVWLLLWRPFLTLVLISFCPFCNFCSICDLTYLETFISFLIVNYKNILKWRQESDTYLTVCRQCWSRQITVKVDKFQELSASTVAFISWRKESNTYLIHVCGHRWSRQFAMKVDKFQELQSSGNLSTFIAICLLQWCAQTWAR